MHKGQRAAEKNGGFPHSCSQTVDRMWCFTSTPHRELSRWELCVWGCLNISMVSSYLRSSFLKFTHSTEYWDCWVSCDFILLPTQRYLLFHHNSQAGVLCWRGSHVQWNYRFLDNGLTVAHVLKKSITWLPSMLQETSVLHLDTSDDKNPSWIIYCIRKQSFMFCDTN